MNAQADRAAAFAARFPRSSLMLEASNIADVFRKAADELDALAGAAHEFDPSTLRRQIRAITLDAVACAVDAEGAES